MNRFMFFAFSAFWGSVLSIWAFAQLAREDLPDAERRFSQEELSRHSSPDDCWMAINLEVYDFSDYLQRHPTPPAVMTPWCGKDATEPYRTKGYGRPHSPAADAMLPGYRIGHLTSGSNWRCRDLRRQARGQPAPASLQPDALTALMHQSRRTLLQPVHRQT